ncbi:MAG: protein-L-isoaspartate(D-aspartate) O-methyltransferase [Chromatiales bacterium]|jgi:protein-L-isoaspartate(D-aspartate) O-methyltransferase|nr:protein-L-isoaspartate(D-aspartate) O-methyltransferase [Chromatiales bacterium]MDH3895195.1 protein-L-isoaspartate(D-aspartate) O-methyltransferase [Chromatiales bacterium]MDH3930617.1 protein-L-isoaspartate(D-aspartate) O-methyltransferase [Chromatiales bacterium]MDH4015461.1 protein-L-isoaspartate(D-aspartate) O-methyltransferase [Chromatiales bacterium]PLX57889.1 MAG: protein-L-isoaspartate O-methyltransferase [Chromatiales bacterium]
MRKPRQDLHGIGMTSARTRERLIQRLREQGVGNERVLERIRNVPRHLFVDEALASRAYEDTALPIGFGQTISQPYVVARMTDLLIEAGQPGKVLEVGTGCGYQTAVLAPLVGRLFSIERIDALIRRARERMRMLDLYQVRLRLGDGWKGWPSEAPFDGILVAAAAPNIPEALVQQLGDGGRLIMPVGGGGGQRLLRVTRRGDSFEQEALDGVSFVPLIEGVRR